MGRYGVRVCVSPGTQCCGRRGAVILSDRSIRDALDAGRVVIDPLDEGAVQPSSVDLRLGHGFRVFRNHTMSHIDVKQYLSKLTSRTGSTPCPASSTTGTQPTASTRPSVATTGRACPLT